MNPVRCPKSLSVVFWEGVGGIRLRRKRRARIPCLRGGLLEFLLRSALSGENSPHGKPSVLVSRPLHVFVLAS